MPKRQDNRIKVKIKVAGAKPRTEYRSPDHMEKVRNSVQARIQRRKDGRS